MDGHILNFHQHLGAVPPDPRIWDHLPYQFGTSLLEILHTGLCMVLIFAETDWPGS